MNFMQAIFIDLPRVSNISEDELVQTKDLLILENFIASDAEPGKVGIIVPLYSNELDKSTWHEQTVLSKTDFKFLLSNR